MDTTKTVEAITNLAEIYAPIVEASAGHRAQLEQAGFSPTIAEMMAAEFHRSMLNMLTSSATK